MLQELGAKGPLLVVDGGNLLGRSARVPESERAQRLVKAGLIAEAYASAGVDGMAIGAADLALGTSALWELKDKHQLPYIASNLRCEGVALPPGRVVERGGLKVGLVALAEAAPEGCALLEAAPAARDAVAGLGPVDVLVLLSALSAEDERAVAAALPGLDFVVHGGKDVLKNTQARALPEGAWQLSAGDRGKALGVAALTWTPGAEGWADEGGLSAIAHRRDTYRARLATAEAELERAKDDKARARAETRVKTYADEVARAEAELAAASAPTDGTRSRFEHRLVELDDQIADHAPTAGLVAQAKLAVEDAERQASTGRAYASTAFVGSTYCQGCHSAAFQQWQGTPHARAYASLTAVQRNLDQDCWSCHVTGAHHPEGPQSPREVGALKDVGCEACHGPGGAHVRDPAGHPMSPEVPMETCTRCHDGAQDEGRFDPGSYLPKVLHGGAP